MQLRIVRLLDRLDAARVSGPISAALPDYATLQYFMCPYLQLASSTCPTGVTAPLLFVMKGGDVVASAVHCSKTTAAKQRHRIVQSTMNRIARIVSHVQPEDCAGK